MHALSLLGACALAGCTLTGCALVAPGPEPTLRFPDQRDDSGDALGDFGVNLRITAAIERHALRRPELSKTVDVQIDAMLAYVRSHGRGALHERSLAAARKKRTHPAQEYARLYAAAVHSMAHLSLAQGPAELSRVALNALLQTLGRDASLTPGHEASALAKAGELSNLPIWMDDMPAINAETGNFVFVQRDGIAFLTVRVLDDEVGNRVLAVLEQWAAAEHPPRAVVIDLSRCEDAAPDATAKLVQALAPGRVAFRLLVRDEKTDKPQQHVFGKADAQWSSPAYATTPVFAIVSERTASLAEAAAHALREHRMAQVLGLPTLGDGRLLAWFELPDHARFSFAIGDVLGVDGEPLRDKPVVPDVCRQGGALVAIAPRSVERARTLCDASLPTQDEAIDYARRVLSVEAAPAAPGATTAP